MISAPTEGGILCITFLKFEKTLDDCENHGSAPTPFFTL